MKRLFKITSIIIIQAFLFVNVPPLYGKELSATLAPHVALGRVSLQGSFGLRIRELTSLTEAESELSLAELFKLTEKIDPEVLKRIAKKYSAEYNRQLWARETGKKTDNAAFVQINARLYRSFKDIIGELLLRQQGVKNVYLMGAFEKSPVGHKINKAAEDEEDYPLYYVRDAATGRIISVVRSDTKKEMAKGNFTASAFSIIDYVPDSSLGGWDDFRYLLDKADKIGINILVDLVTEGTAIDSPWLVDEQLQEGEGYYYVYKDLLEYEQNRLQARVNEQGEFACISNGILENNPGHFLHWSTKLNKWILIANSKDRREKIAWGDLAQLDITNPYERKGMIAKIKRLVNNGVKGFRCDCASASVLYGYDHSPGFWQIWSGGEHVFVNQPGPEEFWKEMITQAGNDIIFVAEAYWLYDKLFDSGFKYIIQAIVGEHLSNQNIRGLKSHLNSTPLEYQHRQIHPVTDHDRQPSYVLHNLKEFPTDTAANLRRDLLIAAALPGIPHILIEQIRGYLARTEARWHALDTVDKPHKAVLDFVKEVMSVAQERLFREGHLYVLDNWLPAVFGFLRHDDQGNRALVVTLAHHEFRQYYEQISIQEAVKYMGVPNDPGCYYALVERLSGKVYVVNGRQLHEKQLTIGFSELGATKIFMFSEKMSDDSGVLQQLCKKNEPLRNPPYIILPALEIDDAYRLVKEFGLDIDFSAHGDIERAMILKHLLDVFTPDEVKKCLECEENISCIYFGKDEKQRSFWIEELKQKFKQRK